MITLILVLLSTLFILGSISPLLITDDMDDIVFLDPSNSQPRAE